MRTLFYIAGQLIPSCGIQHLQKAAKRYVICPYYHTVSDQPLPHISPLYRHRTVSEFRADLDWLMAHYTPIHWNEIDAYEQAHKPAFCLTFDDGLKEFYTIVAPILKEKKIPCVCFLNSAFVDNQDLMVRYREALQQQGIAWRTYLREQQPYMTRDQIRELQARGLDFGCHSIDHPHFEQLSLAQQLTQTTESARALKDLVSHRLFAFPFGQEHLNRTALHMHMGTHEAVFGTANMRPGGVNLYNRIWMENTAMPAKAIIQGEYLREITHCCLHD